MATSVSIDSLSVDDRATIVSALQLKQASVLRAARAESNPAIAKLRDSDATSIGNLIARFS